MKGWTFTFNIDPALNGGCDQAFNQRGEPYWWAVKDGEIAGAGEIDFTGATFHSLCEHGSGKPTVTLVRA